jgi:hypothetical protein
MKTHLVASLQRAVLLTAAIGLIAGTYVFALTRPVPGGADEAVAGPAGSPITSPYDTPSPTSAARP